MRIFGFSARLTGGGTLLDVGCAREILMPLAGDFDSCNTFLDGSRNFPVSLVGELSVECGGGIGSVRGDLGFTTGNPGGVELGTCEGNRALGRAKDFWGDGGESIFTVGGDRGEEIELIEVGRRRRDELFCWGRRLSVLVILVTVCESDMTAVPEAKSGECLRGISSDARSSTRLSF